MVGACMLDKSSIIITALVGVPPLPPAREVCIWQREEPHGEGDWLLPSGCWPSSVSSPELLVPWEFRLESWMSRFQDSVPGTGRCASGRTK